MNAASPVRSAPHDSGPMRSRSEAASEPGFSDFLDAKMRPEPAQQATTGPRAPASQDLVGHGRIAQGDHGPMQVSQEARREPRASAEEKQGEFEPSPSSAPKARPLETKAQANKEGASSPEAVSDGSGEDTAETAAQAHVAVVAVAEAADSAVKLGVHASGVAKANGSTDAAQAMTQSAAGEASDNEDAEASEAGAESPEAEGEAKLPVLTMSKAAAPTEGPSVRLEGAAMSSELRPTPTAGYERAAGEAQGPSSARAGGWSAELVEQLQASQQMSQLKDGRLRLQLNEGSQRLTVMLQEKDGVVNLTAQVNSKEMAEALTGRAAELRSALAELGLSLGDMQAQADSGEASEEQGGEDDAGRPADVPQVTADEQRLPWSTRRIVV